MADDVTDQAIEDAKARGAAKMVLLVYILYLASFVIGLTGVIGVIVAYVNKSDAPDWLKSHYQFQVRTFWIGFLLIVGGIFTLIIGIGYLILLAGAIWYIVRCVKGLKYLRENSPMPNPVTLMW